MIQLAIEDCRLADVSSYLEDAAHFPGGHAAGVVFPRSTSEAADAVASAQTVLAIGAQSSLTGGATPMGELILSTERMTRVLDRTATTIAVEAGVTVAALQDHLAVDGAWFPPAPTFTGAFAGGIVATNAAGAATFKYGSTRDWVEAITVVLADGEILRLRRGELKASGGVLLLGAHRIPVPSYGVPRGVKASAGYFAAPDMDAVDLFVGSEGTLGIITEVTFRVLAPAPAGALALIPCRTEAQAIAMTGALRTASLETRQSRDGRGIDAAAIENMDRRCIEVLAEDGAAAKQHVTFPAGTAMALLVQLELPAGTTADAAYEQIGTATGTGAADTPLARVCRLLETDGLLEVTELAMPGDRRRWEQLIAVREAVPAGVNQRVGHAQRAIDHRIAKTAADMAVPFERFAEMNAIYRRSFEFRGLDYAIWGHISDGNVHPNVIPRSYEDVEKGREAILEFGREAARLGGCPLAEHGVGRNPIKQKLLAQLYGDDGIEQMRAVKRVLDPRGRLAPGVIFPAIMSA
jgi:D-lactate dehydrogenase (cytochrome)